MLREQLMKMSKTELKNRLKELGKNAQAMTGNDLTEAMNEAALISEILDEIKIREDLANAARNADTDSMTEDDKAKGESSETPKNQARAKNGRSLKDGKSVSYKAKVLINPRNTISTATGVVMPQHDSPDIAPTFNDVSSLIDRVKTIPLPGGESYKRPFVVSYGDGAGSTKEGTDYNISEPVFNYAEIVREKITAYSEEPEELVKLPDADYDAVIEDSVTKAIKRYASRQILIGSGGTGKFRGIFYNPEKKEDDIIDRDTDIVSITEIDSDTLDEIIYSYGGDEEVEDIAVLILNKKDLKKFAKLRDKQGRKVYTIRNHGNTGTIDEVPYIINSACAEISTKAESAGKYCMAYGPLSNYEVAVFSDLDARKSEHYKFKQGQIAYRADVFMGGNVIAKDGFIRVKNPTASTETNGTE